MNQPLILRGVYDFPYLSIINYTDANLRPHFLAEHQERLEWEVLPIHWRRRWTKWGST